MTGKIDLPQYDNPPVVELVCGILFENLPKFLAPHIGLLWESFRTEYSNLRQMMPLAPVIERFDSTPSSIIQSFPDDFPINPRVWFESKEGTGLIQVQRDRFLYNWKKVKADDVYLHFDNVFKKYTECLSTFESFLQKHDLGEVKPIQYELTYVNHIPKGQGWNNLNDIGAVFPDLSWRNSQKRFLPELEGLSIQQSFALPDRQGRLHSTIRHGIRHPDQSIIQLDFTCRGIGKDRSQSGMSEWFQLAHQWIVRAFEDLTNPDVQKSIWRRKNG